MGGFGYGQLQQMATNPYVFGLADMLGAQQSAAAQNMLYGLAQQNAYRPTPCYDKSPLPLPVPFCWGPNGPVLLLALMESPLLFAAMLASVL